MSKTEIITKSKDEITIEQSVNIGSELISLYYKLLNCSEDDNLKKFCYIQIVASNESFFKETFSDLINFHKDFLENSKKIIKNSNFKIELEDVYHITKSKITIGDLLAYSLKYSSFDTIITNYNTITNLDLKNEIIGAYPFVFNANPDFLILKLGLSFDANRVIGNIKKAYEIRNIIAHDFLNSTHILEIKVEDLLEQILDTILLQEVLFIIHSAKIYQKYIPEDIDERNQFYLTELENKKTELNSLYEKLESKFYQKNDELFIKSKESFINYVESDSKAISGNLPFMKDIELKNKILLFEQRIKNIKEELKKL